MLKKPPAGELVLLRPDAARFQMVPTLAATLGVQGHRPLVGTRDCQDVRYVFGVLKLISGAWHANTVESLQASNRTSAASQTRRMPKAFAAPVRHVGRRCSTEQFQRVVLTRDNAPWHRGKLINEALVDNPHLELYRLPSYSPNLKVSERFGKKRRRRARHNRLFDTIADLKESIHASLGSFQTIREKVLTLINRRSKRSPK